MSATTDQDRDDKQLEITALWVLSELHRYSSRIVIDISEIGDNELSFEAVWRVLRSSELGTLSRDDMQSATGSLIDNAVATLSTSRLRDFVPVMVEQRVSSEPFASGNSKQITAALVILSKIIELGMTTDGGIAVVLARACDRFLVES